MNKIFINLALGLAAFVGNAALFGQGYDTLKLAKITPHRIYQSTEQSGRAVSVITQDEITNSPASSLDELLRTQVGINLNSRGGFGVQTDIALRGSTFSQVLIMIDNMRLNDPLTGHFNHILPVALSEIAQIEIIRGPAAVAFGSDAVGGLIHIKTKAYMSNYLKDTAQLLADLAYGENNLINGDVYFSKRNKGWNFGVSSKILMSDGQTFQNPNFPNPSGNPQFNTDFSAQTYGIHAGKSLKDGTKIFARYGVDLRDFNAKYFYTTSSFDESRERVNSQWGQINLIRNVYKRLDNNFANSPFLNRSFELNLGYRRTTDSFIFNPLFNPNFHTMQKWALNLNKNYQVNTRLEWVGGAQVEYRTIESTDRGNHDEIDAGIYLIGQYQIREARINLSQRLAYNTNYSFAYLPQISTSVPIKEKWIVRSSFGRSIRAADFTERYVSNNLPTISNGRNVGNPNLQEEISWAGDIMLERKVNQNITFQASLFFRNSENLIDFAPTLGSEINNLTNIVDSFSYLYSQNFESTNNQGLEISVLFSKQFKKWSLNGNLNYTYLATQSNGGVPSKYLANHPTNNIGLYLSLKTNKISLNTTLNYINRNEETANFSPEFFQVPSSYLLINPQVLYNINRKFSIYAQVNNILDEVYQEILGSPMPRRWIFGGVKISI